MIWWSIVYVVYSTKILENVFVFLARKTDGPQLSTLHRDTHRVVANFQNESCGKTFMTCALRLAAGCEPVQELWTLIKQVDNFPTNLEKHASNIWINLYLLST